MAEYVLDDLRVAIESVIPQKNDWVIWDPPIVFKILFDAIVLLSARVDELEFEVTRLYETVVTKDE